MKTASVYYLLDSDGAAVYGGCSGNVRRRLTAHKRRDWWSRVAHVLTGEQMPLTQAREWEAREIARLLPSANVQHIPGPVPDATTAAEVRAALARKKITQTALAEATGRSQTYWQRRLSGERPMDVQDLGVIAQLTGVPVSALVAGAA